jgi:glycosidase
MQTKSKVVMEFHVSRKVRDQYQISDTLFALSGNVILGNFHAARALAQKMNDQRDLARFPEQTVKPGHINTMGLIDEILHYVAGLYREQVNPEVMREALGWLMTTLGGEAVEETLLRFVEEFPPVSVYNGEVAPAAYLAASTDGVSHREIVLEEMLLLWLANENPAFSPFRELFDDTGLEQITPYPQIISELNEYFATQPIFGPDKQNLIEMLRSPAVEVPQSLAGQLAYIREHWGNLLGKHLYRLLRGLDLIQEEEQRQLFLGGAGPAQVYQFGGLDREPERFSPDLEWMPQLVLMAKNAYVWLDQLSRKYRRHLHRLDHVPDEELDTLARWGVTGLWLIGLWERSRASQQIKQLCGNADAVASAYSLFDYQIAADLGGEDAYQDLRGRAWRRGIRLASDMVPNHMGIDSRWVIEHPDWFISLEHSPFPSYRFSGPDLSRDGRVGVFLEDHYYSRSDASVVFRRLDRATGSEKYIYHGNDGTSMPWNDTAQLNYLKAEVREAVMQTILHVARKFPIIRFDAAMTLTKKHYQRLWFPEPGSGGAIPTRAEQGLTKEQFDAAMPREFWQEVVERVAQEVPDTLLLAEAFWMTEGYFVRTLGMHRVYNSAFMNMLKKEENANYRSVMKNTLQFNPEILKRFVNFMNNPDEETAVAQFGKGDKYFGVCTMMATLPGLPVFGHGQIEGLTEKYGMEYRRAYQDEQPDEGLIQRHERDIFPLLHRRRLFAEVEHFLLYDFVTLEGRVNEDVFAYSNRSGDERALVLYHNSYATARGWIRTSVGYAGKTGQGDERTLMQRDLGTGLALHPDKNYFCIFRDHVAGLEYIRNSQEMFEKGLSVELGAYQYHVFLDFREVHDTEWNPYAYLTSSLAGRGVPSIEVALKELFLQPIHQPFKELVNAGSFQQLLDARLTRSRGQLETTVLDSVEQKMLPFLRAIKQFTGAVGNEGTLTRGVRETLETVLYLPVVEDRLPWLADEEARLPWTYLQAILKDSPYLWGGLFGWVFVRDLGRIVSETNFAQQSRTWIDEWLLGRILAGALQSLGLDSHTALRAVTVINLLTTHQRWFAVEGSDRPRARQVLESLLRDADVQQFLMVNRFQNVLWFNKEAFDELLEWLFLLAVIDVSINVQSLAAKGKEELLGYASMIRDLQRAGLNSGYQVEKLLAANDGLAEPTRDELPAETIR